MNKSYIVDLAYEGIRIDKWIRNNLVAFIIIFSLIYIAKKNTRNYKFSLLFPKRIVHKNKVIIRCKYVLYIVNKINTIFIKLRYSYFIKLIMFIFNTNVTYCKF